MVTTGFPTKMDDLAKGIKGLLYADMVELSTDISESAMAWADEGNRLTPDYFADLLLTLADGILEREAQ